MSINPAQIVNDNQQSGLLNLHLRKNIRKNINNGINFSNVKASTNSNMLDLLALLEKQANAVRQSLNPDFVSNDFKVEFNKSNYNNNDIIFREYKEDNDEFDKKLLGSININDNVIKHQGRDNVISFGNINVDNKDINPGEINVTGSKASEFNFDNFMQSSNVIQKNLFNEQEQEQEKQRRLLEQQKLEKQRQLVEEQEKKKLQEQERLRQQQIEEEERKKKLKALEEQQERERAEQEERDHQEALRLQKLEEENYNKHKNKNKHVHNTIQDSEHDKDSQLQDNNSINNQEGDINNNNNNFNFEKNQQIFKDLNFDFEGVTNTNNNNNDNNNKSNHNDNNELSLNSIEIAEPIKPKPSKQQQQQPKPSKQQQQPKPSKQQQQPKPSKQQQQPKPNHFLQINPKNPTLLSSTDLTNALSYLEPQSKQEISKTLTNITTFQSKNKTTNPIKNVKKYTHISSFDSKEKVFGEDIPDFKRKVLINPIKSEWKKRLSFIKKRYFSGLINEEIEFQSAINNIEVSHTEYLDKNYNDRKDYLFQDIQLIPIEDIFIKDNMFPQDHPLNPLGTVESLDTFIEQYSLQNNIKSMNEALSMFTYWRNCLNDGNSFYRVVMFNLLQSLIVQCKVEDLKKIACEINLDKYKDLFDSHLIDSNVVMSILNAIITSLEHNKDKGKALMLLINSYSLKNRFFDLAIIIYYRQLCYDYLKMAYDVIRRNKNEEAKQSIINEESVLVLGKEPEHVMVMLLPYLFNVNLKVLWLNGTLVEHDSGVINLSDEKDETLPIIQMAYFFNSYYPLYSAKMKIIVELTEKKLPELKRVTYIDNDNTSTCGVCNCESKKVYLLQQHCMMCVECLNEHVNAMLAKRAFSLYKSKLNGIEYYSQHIHLKDDYYLTNREFMELYNNNYILNAVNDFILSSCFACNEHKALSELRVLKCKCRYCDVCLQIKCEKATKGYMVLNRYEMNTFEKMVCECNYEFNLNEAVKMINIADQQHKAQNAAIRMLEYVQTKCMNCTIDVRKQNEQGYQDIMAYTNVNIENENESELTKGIDYVDSEHVICLNCAGGLLSTKKNVFQNTIRCSICDKEHFVSFKIDTKKKSQMMKDDKKKMREDDGACCQTECNIF